MPIRWTYTGAVALSAFLAVLSAFLSWGSLSITAPFLGQVASITRYGYESDGIIVLLLGLLAAGAAAYLWYDQGISAYRLGTLFTAFLGALIFAIALINLLDSERAVGSAQSKLGLAPELVAGVELGQFVDIDAGVGIYVAIAAGLLTAAASLAAFAAERVEPFASLFDLTQAACPRCRAALPAGAHFCPACGQKVG